MIKVKCPTCSHTITGWLIMTFDSDRVGPATPPKGIELYINPFTKSGNCELVIMCSYCKYSETVQIYSRLFIEVNDTEALINQAIEKALTNIIHSYSNDPSDT